MTIVSTRWVLAYDEVCGKCRAISRVMRQASRGRLEVAPLTRADVREWRHDAFTVSGAEALWAPTLLRVRADGVRAWTGPAMGWTLMRTLRLPTIVRVVVALGDSRYQATHPPTQRTNPWTRLVRFGLGAIAAVGLLFGGRFPVPTGPHGVRVDRWVARHRNELPRHYGELAEYPPRYRSAIYAASPPWVQQRLWLEAITHARAGLSGTTPAQQRVFAHAIDLAEQRFGQAVHDDGGQDEQRLAEFRTAVSTEFPNSQAKRLLLQFAQACAATTSAAPS